MWRHVGAGVSEQ